MEVPSSTLGGGPILPAPACDLLDRLTRELGVPLTLTDHHGIVVASSGGDIAGQVDAGALRFLEDEAHTRPGVPRAAVMSEARVYVPLILGGRVAGALVAHGAPAEVARIARIAAIASGLALDFAGAASGLGREWVNPGWLLYRLLRGSRLEAQQARVVAAIYGWNLFVLRTAVVVVPTRRSPDRRREAHLEDPADLLPRVLGPLTRSVPFGQVDEAQWVVLPEHRAVGSGFSAREVGERLREEFAGSGLEVDVGIGEPHASSNPLVGLRHSYREAVYSARIGPRLHHRSGIFELRSLGTAAFFAPSSPSRRNLADLVLEPLRTYQEASATLRAYLESNMSVATTADRLGLHRHTVRNHLDRIFSLTGLDPRSLEGAVQLKLALLVSVSAPDAQPLAIRNPA